MSVGASTTTLAVSSTEYAGAWTYSETYLFDAMITVTGSDGSVTTDHEWLGYSFVASGDATYSTFSLLIDTGSDLAGTYTEVWSETSTSGSNSGGSLDWTWMMFSQDIIGISNTSDLTTATATGVTTLDIQSSGSFSGQGTYFYDTEGGQVTGAITATGQSSDSLISSAMESQSVSGTWSWATGTATHAGASKTSYSYAGMGGYLIDDNGVNLVGTISESGADRSEDSDTEQGAISTDGKWTWNSGTAKFDGASTSQFSAAGTGTYTSTTQTSTANGTLSEMSGFSSSAAYSGAATLGTGEKWNWSSGGAKLSMGTTSSFSQAGSSTFTDNTSTSTFGGTTADSSGETSSDQVSMTAVLDLEGTWDFNWGLAKSQGSSWSATSYSGKGSYSTQLGTPGQTGGVSGGVSGGTEANGSTSESSGYSAQQSIGQEGKWVWDSGTAGNSSSVTTHSGSSGSGTYSYSLPGGSGVISGTITSGGSSDSNLSVSQTAALDSSGNWSLDKGTLTVSGGASESSSYAGSGAYSRVSADGSMNGTQTESGGSANSSSYTTTANVNTDHKWEWTAGSSAVTNGGSVSSAFSGSGTFSTPTFGGKTTESGSFSDSTSENSNKLLRSDGKWILDSGTKSQSTSSAFGASYSGAGGVTSTDPSGSISISFAAYGGDSETESSSESQIVGSNGEWQSGGGTRSRSAGTGSGSSYSGKGSYSPGGTGGTSMSFNIELSGGSTLNETFSEGESNTGTGGWQLVSGSKGTSNTNDSNVAYSGAGSFPMGAAGAGSIVFDGTDNQSNSFSESQLVGTGGTWNLMGGGKSNSTSSGHNFVLSGTDTTSGGGISVTTSFAAHDISSNSESTSAKVSSSLGIGPNTWGDETGSKSQSDDSGFTFSAKGGGTQSLAIAGGTINAGILIDMSSTQSSVHSESHDLTGAGWQPISGSRSESSSESSKMQMNGTGTYTRGTVNGTLNLMKMDTSSNSSFSTVESLGSTGAWTFTSGNRSAASDNDFQFTYAGSGTYTYPVAGGQVDGGLTEFGNADNTDNHSQSESINAAGDWQFDVGSKSHSAGNSSTFSSSGTGTYSYAVTGGSVSGTINEANWSTSSNNETEFNTRGSIGGWSSLGTKTSGTAGGSTRDFVGSGSYSINIPDPTDAKKSAGSVSGKIDEGGSTNSNSSESLGWSLSAGNGWQQVSGSRSHSNGNSSNSKSSGSGSYSYTDLENANGIYRSVSHSGKIEEDASSDSGSSASDALMFSTAGVWVRTSGGTSSWNSSHQSSNSSGTGKYTFNVGGTSASPDYRKLSGDVTESRSSLDDQSYSLSTTFTPFGTFVTTGSKSSTGNWSDDSSLTGKGSYSRSVTGGSVTGTITSHNLSRGQSSNSTAAWGVDAFGGWVLLSGVASQASDSTSNEAWNGTGTYSTSNSVTDPATGKTLSSQSMSGTVTDTGCEVYDSGGSSSASKVNSSGEWEQTFGYASSSKRSKNNSTMTGSGTYSNNAWGDTTRSVSGTLSENYNSSVESENSESWVFMKAAFASDMVQVSGTRKLITSSGGSFTSDGSGTYSHGQVQNGKVTRDFSTRSGSHGESKVESFSGGGWTLTWSGSDSSSQSSDNSYSGSGSSAFDPPVITEPFRTSEYHSSGSYEEDFQFQNGNSNSSNWTADATGGKTTTITSSASSLEHRHTASSGGTSAIQVTWYDIPPNPYTAGGKQSNTQENKSNSSNSVTWHVTSNSFSNVTIDPSGGVTGGGLRTGSGAVDVAVSHGNWSRGKNAGPMDKSSHTATYDMTNNSHDGYASVTASIGTSMPATVNMVDGNRTSSMHSTRVEFDMMGNLIVPTFPTPPASTWSQSYLTVTFTEGFYTNPYFAQSPPAPTSLPPATPPSGTGGQGGGGAMNSAQVLRMRALAVYNFGASLFTADGRSAVVNGVSNAASNARNDPLGTLGSAVRSALDPEGLRNAYNGRLDDGTLLTWDARITEGMLGAFDALTTATGIGGAIKGAAKGLGKVTLKGLRSSVDDVAKATCRVAENGGCFTEETEVIVGPGNMTLIAAHTGEDRSSLLAILAAAGVLVIGRVAARRLKGSDEEEEGLMDEPNGRRSLSNLRLQGLDGEPSSSDTELAPRWQLQRSGTITLATTEPQPAIEPLWSITLPRAIKEDAAQTRTMTIEHPPTMSTIEPVSRERRQHATGRNRSRNWLASTVGLLSLLIAGMCLWCALPGSGRAEAVTSPSEVQQYETKRISQIEPLDWVLAGNPERERDIQFGEVIHPHQWRLLKLVAPKKSGGTAEVRMARPLTWLYSQWQLSLAAPEDPDETASNFDFAIHEGDDDSLLAFDEARLVAFDPQQLVGCTIYISVPECGIDGHAQVLTVEDCPNLKPRPGPGYQLVTATFKHRGARVVDVHVAGLSAPIGSTPNHPFWSEDKQQFVRADTLQPGEHLRQADGSLTTVTAVIPRPGTHNVYNLEVHLDHVYHVASNGVLVHNGSLLDCPLTQWVDPRTINFSQRNVSANVIDYTLDMEKRGKHFFDRPLNVIETNAGQFVSLDNKRLMAARMTGTQVPIRIVKANEFMNGTSRKTWGQDLNNKLSGQSRPRGLPPVPALPTHGGSGLPGIEFD